MSQTTNELLNQRRSNVISEGVASVTTNFIESAHGAILRDVDGRYGFHPTQPPLETKSVWWLNKLSAIYVVVPWGKFADKLRDVYVTRI